MRDRRHSEAKLEVVRIVERYKSASTEAEIQQISRAAAETRTLYGEWRVRSLFAEAGLLDISVERVRLAGKKYRKSLVKQHICFAIDNLEDEDHVRFSFAGACQEFFVPRRRPVKLDRDESGLVDPRLTETSRTQPR